MVLKKQTFSDDEISVFDDAVIYKRGEYWHFRMWLAGEGKYARKSLKTRSRSTAIDRGREYYLELLANQKMGKKYFSLTAKEGVEKYLASRQRDVDAGIIVKGRLGTIKTHLEHWLEFIGRDTKLKELERTDCEDYFHSRLKKSTKKKLPISPTTVLNEQSTINAMLAWLFRNNETTIDHFEFKKLPKQDSKSDAVRRSTFSPSEISDIGAAIERYWNKERNKLDDKEWQARKMACYYFLVASITGLRTGEQRQLTWGDVSFSDTIAKKKDFVAIVKLKVRAETSKVRQSRSFMVRDVDLIFFDLRIFAAHHLNAQTVGSELIFSFDGKKPISERFILYHFGKIVALAGIDVEERSVVPYSFRHYFITQKLVNGLNHRQVADMCGTSISQIEKTYYHVDESIMRQAALADYDTGNDGIRIDSYNRTEKQRHE